MGVDRVRMRAVTGQIYDRRRLYIGDTFDAHADEVAELVALNLAVRAINSETSTHEPEPAKGKRAYRRRDLTPE